MSCADVQKKLVDQINAWHTADNCPNGAGEKCLYTVCLLQLLFSIFLHTKRMALWFYLEGLKIHLFEL